MSPIELKELLAEIKAEVTAINKTKGVVSDGQLISKLDEISKDDNQILIGVLPSYGSNGENVDNVRETTICQLMVVEKVSYSDLDEDEFWAVFERAYQSIKLVREIIIRKAGEECLPYLANIDVNSLDINPIWGLSDCNGYSFDFDIA